MFSRLNATQKGLLLVIVPVVFQLLFIAAIYLPLNRYTQTLDSMRKGRQILFALQENEIGLSKIFWFITVKGGMLSGEESDRLIKGMTENIVGENVWKDFDKNSIPELKQAVELSGKMAQSFENIKNKGAERLKNAGVDGFHKWLAGTAVSQFHDLFEDQKTFTQIILDVERHMVAQQPEDLANLKSTLFAILWAGFILSLLSSAGLLFLFTRDFFARLASIEKKTRLLAFDKVLAADDTGSDEIAQLDAILSTASEVLASARARHAVILDNAADVICSIDSRLKFSAVGDASRKAWGFTPDELLGQSILNLLVDDTVSNTSDAFAAVREGNREGKIENVIVCRDGTLKSAIWSVSWSAEERVFFCIVHDITELRTIEKLKQHFLSVASHDLRAPLTSVTLNVSIVTELHGKDLTAGAMQELNRVQQSAQRLSGLVNELLELDKLEAGKLGLDVQRVGVSDACEAAKNLLFGLARQNGITLNGPQDDAIVLAEEKRLVQMITNLLSNAIKFSPAQGTVTISVLRVNGNAEIRISDQGPGIDPRDCQLIFDKFSQSRATASTEIKGTGLGLAVVKALAESHNGQVGVNSQIGKGSTFWLRIPLADTAGALTKVAEES